LPQEIPTSQIDLGASTAASHLSPIREANHALRQMTMQPGIDLEVLRRIAGNDTAMLCDVVQDFVPYAPSVAEIRAAVAGAKAGQVKIVSHRLKGSASLMGAHKLVDACAQLETAVEANNWPNTQSLDISALPKLLLEVRSAIGASHIDRMRQRALQRQITAIEALANRPNAHQGMLITMVRRLPPALKIARLEEAESLVENFIRKCSTLP
jgi:HPt (histidine-containing phosphotransfer) domain-containing protein